MTRFLGGQLRLNHDDTWQLIVDGTVARLDYDFCPNGQSDIQFWFQR